VSVSDAPPPSLVAAYGRALLVAGGWYVTLFAAVVVGLAGVPSRPRPPCVDFECSGGAGEVGLILLVVGVPLVTAVAVLTAGSLALLVRSVRSAVVSGTVAAWVSLAIVACGFALLVRR
jgi:hypothetical protein